MSQPPPWCVCVCALLFWSFWTVTKEDRQAKRYTIQVFLLAVAIASFCIVHFIAILGNHTHRAWCTMVYLFDNEHQWADGKTVRPMRFKVSILCTLNCRRWPDAYAFFIGLEGSPLANKEPKEPHCSLCSGTFWWEPMTVPCFNWVQCGWAFPSWPSAFKDFKALHPTERVDFKQPSIQHVLGKRISGSVDWMLQPPSN